MWPTDDPYYKRHTHRFERRQGQRVVRAALDDLSPVP
jgi:hypothetical protein